MRQSIAAAFALIWLCGVADAAPPTPGVASGVLQKCLGVVPGSNAMHKGPDTEAYCRQLPASAIYDQAGSRFQAGDHAGAAKLLMQAAQAGNAVAQLRLALMYDQGDGVGKSAKAAYQWYARAAAQGEPESLNQMGLAYELGEGVAENWDLAAQYFLASAQQGWVKGQFSLGRAYQFGIGVAQDRTRAIEWFTKAGANGDPNGNYWARWLSDRTNNIGFRDDIERGIVMAGKLRFSGTLYGGDPAGIVFHNSAQRALFLQGQSQRADKDEAETFAKIRQAEYDACRREGRDDCHS
jgi:TPR repeat protein